MHFEELLKKYELGKIKKGSPLFVVAPRIGKEAYDLFYGELVDVRRDETSHATHVGHNPVELAKGTRAFYMTKTEVVSYTWRDKGLKICNPKPFIDDNTYFIKKEEVEERLEEEIKKDPVFQERLERFFREAEV